MQSFYSVDDIRKQIPSRRPYKEFLRVPAMSCGVYVLRAGEDDLQQPHSEDEIYYVTSGVARMKVKRADEPEEDRVVTSGDVIFVAAHEEHRFHSITQDLVLLVVFAPSMT